MDLNPVDLLILTMETDPSGFRFEEEAEVLGIHFAYRLYRDWQEHDFKLVAEEGTKLLARRPHATNEMTNNYFGLFRSILADNQFLKVFDGEFYQRDLLAHEDKVGKQRVMERLGLPVAQTIDLRQEKLTFPLIVKKRFAGRSQANFVMRTANEWKTFAESHAISEYVGQRFYPLRGDYRVLVLGTEVLGVLERKVAIREGGKVGVKGSGMATLPQQVLEGARMLQKALGTDLLGVDVGQRDDGSYFFIEYNFSPQFLGFERESGVNVAARVIGYLMGLTK
jgi:hypothetical protein